MAQLHESFITKYLFLKEITKVFATKVWSYTVPCNCDTCSNRLTWSLFPNQFFLRSLGSPGPHTYLPNNSSNGLNPNASLVGLLDSFQMYSFQESG